MPLSELHVRERLARHEPRVLPSGAGTGYASVAAVLRFSPVVEILLIRRSDKPDDRWSGHMALPGGRREDRDPDLVATAVRETREEVGLDLSERGELLGRLDDVQAVAGGAPLDLIIVPHVFAIRAAPLELTLDPHEVEAALWAPVEPMLRGETLTTRDYAYQGRRLELPAFQVGPHLVWGLTYRMLELLFEAVA